MIREFTVFGVLAGLALMTGCGSTTDSESPGEISSVFDGSGAVIERFGTLVSRNIAPDVDMASQATVAGILNDFSLNLLRNVANTTPNNDSIQSGYSAAVALSLAYAGTAGNTRTALANLLGVDEISEPVLHSAMNALALALQSRANEDLVLHTANRVFVRPELSLQNEYLDIATADYGAPVVEANFAEETDEVTRLINAWVAEQTDDFIPSIIERISPATVFALLNTIFLDAAWQDEYRAIGEREFTALDGTIASVENFGGRSLLPLLRSDDLTAIEIPYGGGDIAMLLLMPISIADFEASLNADTINSLVGSMSNSDVNISIPIWEDEADLDLAQLLAPQGFPSNPWDVGRMIDVGASLEVLAKQKARIEVDENGTRAAAVTIVAGATSVPEFISIDRPFVYLIRDRVTGLILFTGRVVTIE